MNPVSRSEAKLVGAKRFLSGMPCPKGHIAARLTSNGTCCECLRLKADDWANKNPDRVRLISKKSARKSRAENPEKSRIAAHEYRAKNPEKCAAAYKVWYRRNAAEILKKAKEKRLRLNNISPEILRDRRRRAHIAEKENNPTARHESYLRWYEKNKAVAKAKARNRRAMKKKADGKHTAADIKAILVAQNGLCPVCAADLATGFHVDHIVPLIKGGSNWPHNIQCLCPPCNRQKGAKDFIVFLAEKQVSQCAY